MDWVIDLDIRDFFGRLDHELMMKAVKCHTSGDFLSLFVTGSSPPSGRFREPLRQWAVPDEF
jgi:hypothetical protein